MEAYFSNTELALAAYANLGLESLTAPSQLQALRGAGLTALQAERFANKWEVVDQVSSSLSGLSAIVFEEVATGKRYLAIRGTDDGVDIVTNLVNIAAIGATVLHPQYLILRLKVQQWLADGTLPPSFSVTGHSLGGFLATGIAAEFRENVEHAYLFNAPGLGGVNGSGGGRILEALGIVAPVDITRISNIKAEAGISPIAGLGAQMAPPIWISIEDQFFSDVANPPTSRNHNQSVLTDTLALYGTLGRLDPALPAESIGQLFKAASSQNKLTLESALDALRVTLLGKDIVDVNPTIEGNRESFYSNLYALEETAAYQALRGNANISIPTSQSVESLVSLANSDFGYFVSVHYLLPLAIDGASSVVSAGHQDLFEQWQADQAKRTVGATDLVFSDSYLSDRAEMLGLKNLYYQKDGNVALRGDRIETYQFTDRSIKDDRNGQDLTLTVVGRNPLLIHSPAKILFGGDANDSLVGSNVAVGDRLYGGDGSDVLQGNGSTDYLEGGRGNDTYIWNTGDGFDTIRDSDGIGTLVVDGHVVSGAIKVAEGVYISADKEQLMRFEGDALSGGVLLINGSLRIENFTNGELGVVLADQGSIAEIQATTHLFQGPPWFDVEFGTDEADHAITGQYGALFVGKGGDDLLEVSIGTLGPRLAGGAGNDVVIGEIHEGHGEYAGDAGQDILLGSPNGETLLGDFWSFTLLDMEFRGSNFHYAELTPDDPNHQVVPSGQFHSPHGGGVTELQATRFADYLEALNYVLGVDATTEIASHYDDYLDGGGGGDRLLGGYGSDTLLGGPGNDTLEGDDFLLGFQFAARDAEWKEAVVGLFGRPGDDYLDGGEGDDQLTDRNGGNDVFFGGAGNDRIQSADSSSGTESFSNYLSGGDGNDSLWSSNMSLDGFDILTGGAGNDTLHVEFGSAHVDGGPGHDTYIVVDRASGLFPSPLPRNLVINDFDGSGGLDRLRVSLLTPLSEVSITRDELNLYIGRNNDPAWISVENWFAGPQYKIEQIDIDSMATIGVDQSLGVAAIESRFTTTTVEADFLWGSRGDDQLAGSEGDDTLSGDAGNDTLVGNEGNDILNGGDGSDMYVFSVGDGIDRIFDSGSFGTDSVTFGPGITSDSLALGLGSLRISIGQNGDAIHFEGFDPKDAANSGIVEYFQFADGTGLSYQQLLEQGFDLAGTGGDDTLGGTSVNDRLRGYEGDDIYHFGPGSGTDYIEDSAGELDAIVVSEGISPDSVSVSRSGAMLVFTSSASPDRLTLRQEASSGFKIERVEFSDGTVWDAATLESLAAPMVNNVPVLANPLPDQKLLKDVRFTFQLPVGTFIDIDEGDKLDYGATLVNGEPLPAWLAFDPLSRTFSGTPAATDSGKSTIRVTATDQAGASATDELELVVTDVEGRRRNMADRPDHDEHRGHHRAGHDDRHDKRAAGRKLMARGEDRTDRKEAQAGNSLSAYLERVPRYEFESLALELERRDRGVETPDLQEIARRWRVADRYASFSMSMHDEEGLGAVEARFHEYGRVGGPLFGGGSDMSWSNGTLPRAGRIHALVGLEEGLLRLHG